MFIYDKTLPMICQVDESNIINNIYLKVHSLFDINFLSNSNVIDEVSMEQMHAVNRYYQHKRITLYNRP
jgi:hypothetical protein